MKKINIAIDGPAGSGKSSVAKQIAKELGLRYLDTGAMFRAISWSLIKSGMIDSNIEEIRQLVKVMDMSINERGNVVLDGQELTFELRTPEVTSGVSRFAQIKEIRSKLKTIQVKIAKEKGVIMDGRDIGTVIMPDAELKIFLTASSKVRAERRYKELSKELQEKISVKVIQKDIENRDKSDKEREIAPLKKADSAIEVDTSNMTKEEVINTIKEKAKALME